MADICFDTVFSEPVTGVKHYVATAVAVHTSQGSCDTLDVRGTTYLSVKPPTSVTSLTFYGSPTRGGTYVLIDDLGTNGVVTCTANVWKSIDHTKLAAIPFIQMKSAGSTGNAIVVAKSG